MKTAISLPDELFRRAEVAARRLGISRSQFYATAIDEFLRRGGADTVTEKLNEIYSRNHTGLDPELHTAQIRSLTKESR